MTQLDDVCVPCNGHGKFAILKDVLSFEEMLKIAEFIKTQEVPCPYCFGTKRLKEEDPQVPVLLEGRIIGEMPAKPPEALSEYGSYALKGLDHWPVAYKGRFAWGFKNVEESFLIDELKGFKPC